MLVRACNLVTVEAETSRSLGVTSLAYLLRLRPVRKRDSKPKKRVVLRISI